MKPKALIMTGFGINCELETEYAFKLAGALARRVHINELIDRTKCLDDYHILSIPGGFAHGDFLGAGKALALKLRTKLNAEVQKFVKDGKLIIGICNGFQVLVKSGLLPGLQGDYSSQSVTLMRNSRGRFEDRWVSLNINHASPCIWTRGIDHIELPVRHGEGMFFTGKETLRELEDTNLVAARYAGPNLANAEGKYPFNPNGSPNDIAALCDPSGRIFGLMPHPEGYLHYTNHPLWTRLRDERKREKLPEEGMGVGIFRNAVKYARKNLVI